MHIVIFLLVVIVAILLFGPGAVILVGLLAASFWTVLWVIGAALGAAALIGWGIFYMLTYTPPAHPKEQPQPDEEATKPEVRRAIRKAQFEPDEEASRQEARRALIREQSERKERAAKREALETLRREEFEREEKTARREALEALERQEAIAIAQQKQVEALQKEAERQLAARYPHLEETDRLIAYTKSALMSHRIKAQPNIAEVQRLQALLKDLEERRIKGLAVDDLR